VTQQAAPSATHVGSAAGGYDALVGSGLFEKLPELLQARVGAHRYAVISDHRVAPLHGEPLVRACAGAGLEAHLFTFAAGEASKTRKQWSILTDALLDAGVGRDGCVVAVGGGVTGDLAGFVAATFMRGIALVQVPTSYLAMVDASVGGKTGVDLRHGKNLVGAFHAPRLVLADPRTLTTLPEQERAQGLVEAFKHGAIRDAAHFEWLGAHAEALLAADAEAASEAVLRSVEIKAAVVSADERESGLREVLNFGHTVGHALEAESRFDVAHGTAVAEGMLLEAEIGERLGVTEPGTGARLAEALRRLELPPLPTLDATAVSRFLAADKKARSGRARYVLLKRLGEVDGAEGWSREVPDALVLEVLEERLRRV
jgi:3-dehydroquinate synthase